MPLLLNTTTVQKPLCRYLWQYDNPEQEENNEAHLNFTSLIYFNMLINEKSWRVQEWAEKTPKQAVPKDQSPYQEMPFFKHLVLVLLWACGILTCASPSVSREDSVVWLQTLQNDPTESKQLRTAPGDTLTGEGTEPGQKSQSMYIDKCQLARKLSPLGRRAPTLPCCGGAGGLQVTVVANSTCSAWNLNHHEIRLETTQVYADWQANHNQTSF